jgi:hypothetical protein
MPDDVARLLSLNIGITLSVIAIVAISTWGILHEIKEISRISERVAGIAERLDVRLRRQYADIDRDLQDIKERLG